MKTKKLSKKLKLMKSTVANINASSMKQLYGGENLLTGEPGTTCCDTYRNCPIPTNTCGCGTQSCYICTMTMCGGTEC